jgi:hypothetical protein
MNQSRLTLGSLLVALLSGCGNPQPPANNQLEAEVRGRVPAVLQLQQFRVVSVTPLAKEWQVQFEATLAPRETLYRAVNLDEELVKLQWKKNAPVAFGANPVLLRPVQEPKDAFTAVGQLTARRNGVQWQFSDFRWDVTERVLGQARRSFGPAAVVLGSPEANAPILAYLQQGKFAVLTLSSGLTYREVALDSFDGESFMFSHAKGIGQDRFEELPPVLQALFYFDMDKVQADRAQRAAAAQAQVQAARQQIEAAAAQQARATAAKSAVAASRPEPPPANVDDLIVERLRRYTTSPNTILVKTKSPVFDETVGAWKVEFDYSFYKTDGRSAGGHRIEGTSYAWFRDKLLVRWRDIVPPRSPY